AAERVGLIEDLIVAQVCEVCGITDAKVDRSAPLTSLGLDSLMTVELVNRMERLTGIRIPMGSLFSGPSIAQLAHSVLRLLVAAQGAAEAAIASPPVPAAADDAAHMGPDADLGHVVPLRDAGDRPPVMIFHPVGGSIAVYTRLARHLSHDVA